MADLDLPRGKRVSAPRLAVLPLFAALLFSPVVASADGFATPPSGESRRVVVLERGYDPPPRDAIDFAPFEPDPSVVRFFVGPAGKLDRGSATAGLLTAVDIGKGPAGFRLTGAWMDVGGERGLSQYTGELTIDFGGRSEPPPPLPPPPDITRPAKNTKAIL